jgi:hypothetical protein
LTVLLALFSRTVVLFRSSPGLDRWGSGMPLLNCSGESKEADHERMAARLKAVRIMEWSTPRRPALLAGGLCGA